MSKLELTIVVDLT